MAKHKVTTDPSTAYTGTVVDIESVEGQYGAQYKITFEDGTEIYEKTDAVERQLGRLSIGVADILGETLRFSRTPMKNDPSKGFLNIDKARAVAPTAKRPAAPAKAAHSAGPLVPGLDALDDFDIIEEEAAVTADLQRALRPSASKVVRAPEPVAPAPVGGETLEHFIERYTAFAQAFVNGPGVIYAEAQVPYDGATIQSAFASFDIGNQRGGKR